MLYLFSHALVFYSPMYSNSLRISLDLFSLEVSWISMKNIGIPCELPSQSICKMPDLAHKNRLHSATLLVTLAHSIVLGLVGPSVHHTFSGAGNTGKTTGPIYLFIFNVRSIWIHNALLFHVLISSVMSVETDKNRLRLNVSNLHWPLHATRLQMLVLCSLMQPFIMAMLKLHAIIDCFTAVDPQIHGGVETGLRWCTCIYV